MRGGVFNLYFSGKGKIFSCSRIAQPPSDFPCRPQGKPSVAETPTRVGLRKFCALCCSYHGHAETKARLAPLGFHADPVTRGLGHSRRRAPLQDRRPIGESVRCGVSVYAPTETSTYPLGTKFSLTKFNRLRSLCVPRRGMNPLRSGSPNGRLDGTRGCRHKNARQPRRKASDRILS